MAKTYRKKGLKRKTGMVKKVGSGLQVALQALTIARGLKALINVERKFIDNTYSGSAVSTTPSVQCINLTAQGTTNTTRVGNSLKMSNLTIEGYVTLNSAAAFDYVRLAVILDRQCTGILASYSPNIYESTTPISPRNKQSVDRFTVLKEFKLQLDQNGNQIQKFTYFSKMPLDEKDRHVKYNGTGGTIADLYTNAILLVWVGVQATNQSNISAISRIRYVDN